MAACILNSCGRVAAFKTSLFQAWGLRSLPSAAFLSTKQKSSKTESKKNKGGIITNTKADATVKLAEEDLRKFLARKTLVTFPQKVKLSPLEGEFVFSSKRDFTEKLADEESSTSSSSDSDSSSDSEEEYDAFKESIKTKVSFPRRDYISSADQTTKMNIVSQKHFPQEQVKGKNLPYSPRITEMPVKQKQLHETTADDKLFKSDSTKYTTDQIPKESHLQSSEFGTKIIKSQRPREVARNQGEISDTEAAPSTLSRIQTMPQQSRVQNLTLLKNEEGTAKELQKIEEQGRGTSVLQQDEEVLNGRMAAVDPTAKEEMVLEAGVQTEQSTTQDTKSPVEPVQETHDISTYKNLQHHKYTPYTFVDYDVLLSKMRLPQPSSGRSSPSH